MAERERCKQLFYTKTYVNKFQLGKSLGGGIKVNLNIFNI